MYLGSKQTSDKLKRNNRRPHLAWPGRPLHVLCRSPWRALRQRLREVISQLACQSCATQGCHSHPRPAGLSHRAKARAQQHGRTVAQAGQRTAWAAAGSKVAHSWLAHGCSRRLRGPAAACSPPLRTCAGGLRLALRGCPASAAWRAQALLQKGDVVLLPDGPPCRRKAGSHSVLANIRTLCANLLLPLA